MQKTNTEPSRQGLVKILAPATTLLLLSALATPALAQRGGGHSGRGGSGHHGQVGGHSGHRGGHSSYGGHRYGRHDARGHHGYRSHRNHGNRGSHGYRGDRSYRGHSSYRGNSGFRVNFGYGGHSSYRGAYGYAGSYGRYAPYSSYVYYRHPRSYGYSYRGYPDVSVVYEAPPTYVVGGKTYPAPAYASELAIPENTVAAPDVPTSAAEPYDARAQPARVKLSIEPGDASVYLDGRFLGLASELPEELWIDAGAHRLEVVRPGFTGQELDLELEAGEELDVDARLEAQTPVPDLHR